MSRFIQRQRGFNYEYVTVDRDWNEGERIHGVLGGGYVDRVMTALKESGSLPVGDMSQIPDDGRLRIWCNDAYTGMRFPLATMLCRKPTSNLSSSAGESGNVRLESVLATAAGDRPTGIYTVAAGTNIVNEVERIFTSLGYRVAKTPSSSVAAEDRQFDPNDWDWLSIANELLTGTPNYSSAWPDRYGTVMLVPYVEPREQAPFAVFSDRGSDYRFKGSLVNEDDWYEVPNRLVLTAETDEASYISVVEDRTGSRLSYDARGYWRTDSERLTELPESGIQAYLDDRAEQMLRAKQSNVAATEFPGEYVDGLNLGNVVELAWDRIARDYIRSVYSMRYNLTPALLVDYRIREYMRGAL